MSLVSPSTSASTTDKVSRAILGALEQYRERLDGDAFADGIEIEVKLVARDAEPRSNVDVGDVRAVVVRHTSVLRVFGRAH